MRLTFATPAVLAIFAAPVAWADLTAEEVWKDWQSNFTSFGYTYSANEERSGNQLTLTNLIVSSTSPENDGSAQIALDRIVLTEQSDGSVSVSLPAVSPLVMTSDTETGGLATVKMNVAQDGLRITATGTPANLQYAYTANRMAITSTEIEMDGQILPADTNNFEARLDELSGTSNILLDTMRRNAQSLEAAEFEYNFSIGEPDSSEQVDLTGGAANLQFNGTSASPLEVVQAENMSSMLDAGFAVDGMFTFQDGKSQITAVGEDERFAGSFTSTSGDLKVTMGESGLTYAISQNALNAQIAADGIPVPVEFSVGEAGVDLKMPLRKSETAQDFGLGLRLDGFAMSDILWGLFDPAAQLPRDPATVIAEIAGKGRLLFDFLDPEAASLSGNPDITPAEVESVDINRVQISVAGADLTGNGAFRFDNSAGGAPRPVGGVDLMLVGGNALLDKLVAIGIVPQEQATGVRMMMGLLAVPGAAPDTLNSRIEINDQGHISANGQRIQ